MTLIHIYTQNYSLLFIRSVMTDKIQIIDYHIMLSYITIRYYIHICKDMIIENKFIYAFFNFNEVTFIDLWKFEKSH